MRLGLQISCDGHFPLQSKVHVLKNELLNVNRDISCSPLPMSHAIPHPSHHYKASHMPYLAVSQYWYIFICVYKGEKRFIFLKKKKSFFSDKYTPEALTHSSATWVLISKLYIIMGIVLSILSSVSLSLSRCFSPWCKSFQSFPLSKMMCSSQPLATTDLSHPWCVQQHLFGRFCICW